MQHSVFDRIYITFLIILIVSFVFLIYFISYFTRKSLISEKQQTLTNEASLIASQAVSGYFSGELSEKDLSYYLTYYSSALNADIWYADPDGRVISHADIENKSNIATPLNAEGNTDIYLTKAIPDNIYNLDSKYALKKNFHTIGNFYGMYSGQVLTINVPVTYSPSGNNTSSSTSAISSASSYAGTLILHAPAGQVTNAMKSIYSISYIPCLIIIAIAFFFLAIMSHKVINPIKKLSAVAQEYSKGNFDAKTEIHSNDEIGQLADSMEYMADELSKFDEYRHDFVSNISHDFRSPLTSINGYIEAILDGTIPPESQSKYLHVVQNETNRLTKLTNGLLDLDRLESYGPYLKISNFDFIDVVKSTLNTFEIKCINKNIAIYLNNHAENTFVSADKTKIQQVVYNLIDNAFKFTPAGKKIYVTITEKEDKLNVSVKDEGIGMNDDTAKKIWTRFYKGDTSRGKDKGGTGLGLAITKEIMKAHNETIEVISHEGEGSEFIFTLPKMAANDTSAKQKRADI